MPALPQVQTLMARDGRLRVEFEWHADRFAQRVCLDQTEVGGSIDGDPQDPWPPSPPIQQISLEEIGGSTAILGVGAAGRGHWSISVELDGESAIKFDLACRCKAEARFLGSTYRLADSVIIRCDDTVLAASDGRITIPATTHHAGTHRWRYSLYPAGN